MGIIATTAAEVWKVALGALILGAGLPVIFSLGLRSLYGTRDAVVAGADGQTHLEASRNASGTGRPAGGSHATGKASPAGMLGAVICFAIVVAAILFGIVVLIWGSKIFGK